MRENHFRAWSGFMVLVWSLGGGCSVLDQGLHDLGGSSCWVEALVLQHPAVLSLVQSEVVFGGAFWIGFLWWLQRGGDRWSDVATRRVGEA